MNGLVSENNMIKVAIAPKDGAGAATVAEKVALNKSFAVAILLNFGASAGATVNVNLKQEDESAVAKDLLIKHPMFVKAGAETVFTKIEATNLASHDFSAELADDAGVVVLEVKSDDLDTNADFSKVFVELDDAVASKLVSAEYVLSEPRFRPAYKESI